MTEDERYIAIMDVLGFWLPYSWLEEAARYTYTEATLTGDVEDGGVDVTVLKDGATGTIQFTNDECYGTPLTASQARTRVYNGTYS
jgi:hypothetical protein